MTLAGGDKETHGQAALPSWSWDAGEVQGRLFQQLPSVLTLFSKDNRHTVSATAGSQDTQLPKVFWEEKGVCSLKSQVTEKLECRSVTQDGSHPVPIPTAKDPSPREPGQAFWKPTIRVLY